MNEMNNNILDWNKHSTEFSDKIPAVKTESSTEEFTEGWKQENDSNRRPLQRVSVCSKAANEGNKLDL